jgi:hypothetical protein
LGAGTIGGVEVMAYEYWTKGNLAVYIPTPVEGIVRIPHKMLAELMEEAGWIVMEPAESDKLWPWQKAEQPVEAPK